MNSSTTRYQAIVDVHLILIRDGLILLAERQGTGYADGLYNLPSGHLEDGESVVDGAIREAAEEVGIRLDPAHLRCATVLHHRNPEGRGRIGFFFEATHWHGEPENREPTKCAKLTWADPTLLPSNTVPYAAAGIHAYVTSTPFALHGWPELSQLRRASQPDAGA